MDVFLTARGTQGWVGLGLNIFAAGLGVWTILTLPQTGFTLGIQGAFNYAFACIAPILLLIFMGKIIRERAPDGVTITQYVLERFGWAAQVATNITSLGYMFVFLISELTSLAFLLTYFGWIKLGLLSLFACVPPSTLNVDVFSILKRKAIGGMPASLLTDKFQGWFVIGLAVLAVIAFGTSVKIDKASIPDSSVMKTSQVGWESLWTLTAAITGANIFHQGYWQRVYSARSQKDLLYACIFASVLTFPFFFIIGFVGVVDVWRNDPAALADPLLAASNAFFNKITLTWARLLTAVLNIPALIVAYKGLNVFSLFLIADLCAATIVLPVVIGLLRPFDKFFNGLDFVVGTLCGLFSVVAYGWGETGSFNYGLNLLALPNQIFQPVESVVVFSVAPGGSVVGMLLCALLRRAIVKATGGDPNFRPVRPTVFSGPGAPVDSLMWANWTTGVKKAEAAEVDTGRPSISRDPVVVVDDDTQSDVNGGLLLLVGRGRRKRRQREIHSSFFP
ncbi:hypothetical protein BC829DRAFT_415817 [Chytridium lagenaria]|nr:hypothetical protein BC829DRAFT_415817 [Chytridium lagenaria]